MIAKIGYVVGFVLSFGVMLSTLKYGAFSGEALHQQVGLMVALFHAGGVNMFDNFAFNMAMISTLPRKEEK